MAKKISIKKPNFAKNKPNSQKRTPHKQNVNLQKIYSSCKCLRDIPGMNQV